MAICYIFLWIVSISKSTESTSTYIVISYIIILDINYEYTVSIKFYIVFDLYQRPSTIITMDLCLYEIT